MTSLTIDLDNIPDGKKGLVLSLFAAILGVIDTEDDLKSLIDEPIIPVPQDPTAAFGAPIPTGPISAAGPSLVIPADPTPVPAASIPPSGGATLDKSGLPWDARIHASSKATNGDGTWRVKRGVDKITVEKVNAELRQVMSIPSPGPQLVPAPPPPSGTVVAPPPPPVENQAQVQQKYIDLFGRVSAAMSAGKLSEEQLNKCLQSLGIPSLPLLGARLDLVPQACNLIDGVILGVIE